MKAEPSDPLEVGVTSEVSGKLPQVSRPSLSAAKTREGLAEQGWAGLSRADY